MAIQEVDIRTGASQQAAALADNIESFRRRTSQAAAIQAEEQGQRQALKDCNEGDAAFKSSFGVSGRAYNQTLATAYKASAKSDLSKSLSAIANEYPDDIKTYNDLAQEQINSMIDGADPLMRDELAIDFDLLNSQFQKQVQGNNIKRNLTAAREEIASGIRVKSDNALGALANADTDEEVAAAAIQMQEAIELIDSQDHLNETQRGIQKENLAKGFAEQSFLNPILKAQSSQEAFKVLEDMQDVPAGWSPEAWDDVLNKGFAHANKLARAEDAALKANIELAEAEALDQRGSVLFENGIAIDPYKTTESAQYDYKAINSYYDNVYSEEIAQLPINDQLNANTAFVQRTGIVPQQVESRINAFARSGDVTQAAVAADQLARIQEVSSQSLKDMPAETKAILLAVSDATRAGSDVAAALEAARLSAYGMTEAQKESIKIKTKEYNADLSSNLASMLDDDFDTSYVPFVGAPSAPPAMEAEFKVNFDRYMILADGNADQAERLAYSDLKNVWAVSDITGGFMKYAPESVYGISGVDNDWIKTQFEEETAGLNNATIVVDAATARSKKPEYKLMQEDDNGIMMPVYDDNNMPLAWVPDYTESTEYKEFQEQPTTFEKAKMQRERNKVKNLNQKVKLINARMRNSDLETAIRNSVALGDINEIEAEQLREYYANKD